LGPDAPIRAFAAVYDEPGISERPYLEAVVRQHHLQADVLAPDWNHFTANISDVLDKQDEPISATAVVGYRALMQAARAAGVKVILNGQGADEVLGGYDKFFAPYLRELRRTDPAQLPAALWHIWRRGQFDATDALRRGLAYRRAAPLPWMASPTLPLDGYRRLPDTDMLHCSHNLLGGVGFPVLLHYEDRNAMAEGIESRLPFLDVDFVNFVLPLPAAYKIRGGWRKHLLRTAMADVLPDVVRYRSKKLGFATPQHRWMDAHPALFTDWVAQTCRRYPDYLSPAAVAWSQDVLRSRNYPAYNTVWRIGIFGMFS
jgi:asparagine synthase (glutamine-hydrolysing)